VAAGLDPDYLQELFAAFGPVSVRRMFGGAGLFADGMMIAIVADGMIYLKTAPEGTDAFERERCGPFSYATKNGTRQITSYWQMPERLYDDPDELAQWARTALAVAQAGQAKKARPKRAAPPKARKRRT
jgi:DNA transformation protein and related proteins